MQVNKEVIDDIHLFDIAGEVGLYTVTELKELLNSCIDEGNIKIILDFRNSSHIDSSGFALIFSLNNKLIQKSSKLRVLVDKKKTLLFQHFTVEKKIDIFHEREPAIQSFTQ
jgi:anti-sigma B factor antagonist